MICYYMAYSISHMVCIINLDVYLLEATVGKRLRVHFFSMKPVFVSPFFFVATKSYKRPNF